MKTNRRNFIKGAAATAAAVLAKLQIGSIVTAEEQEPAVESAPMLLNSREPQASAAQVFPVTANLTASIMSSCCDFDFFVSYGRCVSPERPITYIDAELMSHDEKTGAMTFKYGEATNEPT